MKITKSKHPLYPRYNSMMQRCCNRKNADYHNWGGSGIKVCDEWMDDFWCYAEYIISLPNAMDKGRSIDRINNKGNYEPGNIRWATFSQQSKNKRQFDYVPCGMLHGIPRYRRVERETRTSHMKPDLS